MLVKAGQLYRHHKGTLYQVVVLPKFRGEFSLVVYAEPGFAPFPWVVFFAQNASLGEDVSVPRSPYLRVFERFSDGWTASPLLVEDCCESWAVQYFWQQQAKPVWVRSLANFTATIQKDGQQVPRFSLEAANAA